MSCCACRSHKCTSPCWLTARSFQPSSHARNTGGAPSCMAGSMRLPHGVKTCSKQTTIGDLKSLSTSRRAN